jgi:hypothetical protein
MGEAAAAKEDGEAPEKETAPAVEAPAMEVEARVEEGLLEKDARSEEVVVTPAKPLPEDSVAIVVSGKAVATTDAIKEKALVSSGRSHAGVAAP